MIGRTSEAGWRVDCLWVGGFCIEFISDTWPTEEGINDNGGGGKCPRNGVERVSEEKSLS